MLHHEPFERKYRQYLGVHFLERHLRIFRECLIGVGRYTYPALEVRPTVGFIPTRAFLSAGLITIIQVELDTTYWQDYDSRAKFQGMLTAAIRFRSQGEHAEICCHSYRTTTATASWVDSQVVWTSCLPS